MFQDMTEKQFRGWQSYYEVEPWGEERADWRTEVFQMRMMHRLFPKGAAKPPDAIWPYFPEMPTPAELKAAGEKFDDAIEPKPGGGYRWKPGREPKLDGNDNR